MRSVIRHLVPLVRSRRRIPFLLVVTSLICTALILYTVDRHRHTPTLINENEKQSPIKNQDQIVTTSSRLPGVGAEKNKVKSVDEQGRSTKTEFLALDWNGFFGSAAGEGERTQCPSSNTSFFWTRQQNRLSEVDFVVSHDSGAVPFDRLRLDANQQQYSMAFVMESEVHSSTGNGWAGFKFKMTYNLDDSYPEPATYFDMNTHLIDLLRPATIPFELKEKQADIVWIISNCNAHSGREGFIQQLMQEIKVDSYGPCLNNRQGYQSRMTDNVDAYKKYKFVVAIENSNCVDYVTEKLVKAVQSGSIPIVAGRDGRPDYRRYMPVHSFINVFDYPSVKALADDLKRIANNRTLYESYLWYKKHDKDVSQLATLSLDDKLKHFTQVVGSNSTMLISGIAAKEKSENKVCKLIRFIRQTSWQEIAAHNGTARAGSGTACLPAKSIVTHFDSNNHKSNQSALSSS